MSSIKRYMEQQEEIRIFVNALRALVENEEIQHEVSLGIAKRIIDTGSTEGLSPKQIAVFEKHIEPLLTPNCEREECCSTISPQDLPNAYLSSFENGGLYCEECQYEESRIRNLK